MKMILEEAWIWEELISWALEERKDLQMTY